MGLSRENKWIRHTATTLRILLGLFFIFAGVSYFFMTEMPPMDHLSTNAQLYIQGLVAAGFFMPLLKITEAIAGLMLLFRRWTPLGLIVMAPIHVQILFYAIFLDNTPMVFAVVDILISMFLAWYHWEKFAPLFKA